MTVSSIAGKHYGFTSYVGVLPQTLVFSRFVNMASITYPVTAITFDGSGTGAYTDIKENQTLLVYDQNTTTLKGRLQVSAGAATSTVIQVEEFSKGSLDLADNDRIEVVDEYRIWTWLIEASAAFRKRSRITYTDQTDDYPPTANGGGWWYGFCDTGQTYATINFDWTTSFPNDPDNTGGLTYLVDPKDGTITVGTDTDDTCTITFPYGQRWIELTVTDADNGASHTQPINIDVYHKTLRLPLSIQIQNRTYTHDSGWSITGVLPSSASAALNILPDGAPIGVFEEERYDGTVVSYGSGAPTERSHIKGVYFLVRDSVRVSAEGDEVTFEAVSPLEILNQTAALPQLMVRDSTPSKWTELRSMTVGLALDYVKRWGASFPFDFLTIDGTEYNYKRLAIEDDSSLGAQLRDLASAINVKLTCDRLGRLILKRDPNYTGTGGRAGNPTLYAITVSDFMELEFATEHRNTVKFVRGEFIMEHTSTSGARALFSNWPGNAPGEGTTTETLPRQVAFGQTDANERTGHHGAKLNGLFYDVSTKAITHVPQGASVTLADSYDFIDPALLQWVTLALPASTNGRGRSFTSSTRWLVDSMDVSYSDGNVKDVRATISHETRGVLGVSYVMPQSSENGLPSIPPLDLALPVLGELPALTPIAPVRGTNKIGTISGSAEHLFTDDFNAPSVSGGPTWTEYAMASLGHSGSTHDFVSDPFSPLYLGTGDTVNIWEVSSTHIHRCADFFAINADPAYTSYHTFAAAPSGVARVIQMERANPDWVMVISYDDSYGTKCAYSTNASDATPTFTEVSVTAFSDGTGVQHLPSLYMSPHTDGLAYTVAFDAGGAGHAYKTLDYGATWAQVSNPNFDVTRRLGNRIEGPFAASDAVFYITQATGTGSGPFTYAQLKVTGATQTDVSPVVSAVKYAASGALRDIRSDDNNANNLLMVGRSQNTSTTFGVFKSVNGASSWQTICAPSASSPYRNAQIGGGGVYLLGEGRIWYADWATLTAETDLDERTGNMTSTALLYNVIGG